MLFSFSNEYVYPSECVVFHFSGDRVQINTGAVADFVEPTSDFGKDRKGSIHCIANDLPWGVLRNNKAILPSDIPLSPEQLNDYVAKCKPLLDQKRGILALRVACEMAMDVSRVLVNHGFSIEGPIWMIRDTAWAGQKSVIKHRHKAKVKGIKRASVVHAWVIGHLQPENRVPLPKKQFRK